MGKVKTVTVCDIFYIKVFVVKFGAGPSVPEPHHVTAKAPPK
jgi:hypothetical protein